MYIDALKKSSLSETELVLINNIIDDIYHEFSDDEFFRFIQRLSLNRKPDHQNTSQSIFNEDGFKQVFFKILLNVSNVLPEINKKEQIILYKSFRYILTTIIDEQDDAKEVVQNILTNLVSQKILWEKTSLINKEIDVDFQSLNPDFFDIRKKAERDQDFKSFIQFNGSTSLISKDNTIKNLKNGTTD